MLDFLNAANVENILIEETNKRGKEHFTGQNHLYSQKLMRLKLMRLKLMRQKLAAQPKLA